MWISEHTAIISLTWLPNRSTVLSERHVPNLNTNSVLKVFSYLPI